MPTTARKQLRQFQKSLYEKAYADAQSFSAMGTPTILNYSDKFQDSIPDDFTRTNLKSLITAMGNSHFTLYGDFHTHRQSQKGLIRILRSYRTYYPEREIVLGLEMFKSKDQKYIDQYLEGEITETQLLDKTNYRKDWGFPWRNYKLVLDFAQDFNIKVFGVNTDNSGKDNLETRDRFCAKVLQDIHKKHPDKLVICLIGEYHLANAHLPRYLAEGGSDPAKCLRILLNVDRYYFQNPPSHKIPTSEYLQLSSDIYCIINSPPWIKWQSYAIWEEMRNIEEDEEWDDSELIDDPSAVYNEESIDVDYQVHNLLYNLVNFLQLPNQSSDLTRFRVFLSPGQDVFEDLVKKYQVRPREVDIAIESTTLHGYYFFPWGFCFIIEDISLNNLAEMSGQYLHHINQTHHAEDPETAFYRRIFSYAAGMTSSKILNPRRKGGNLWQYRVFLQKNTKKRLIGHAQAKRETNRGVLRFHDWMIKRIESRNSKGRSLTSIFKLDEQLCFEISRCLGHVLGFNLYSRVMGHKIPSATLQKLFQPLPEGKVETKRAFFELYELIMTN